MRLAGHISEIEQLIPKVDVDRQEVVPGVYVPNIEIEREEFEQIELLGKSNFWRFIKGLLANIEKKAIRISSIPDGGRSLVQLFGRLNKAAIEQLLGVANQFVVDMTLIPYRRRIGAWSATAQPGKLLLVKAPMGLGKTTSVENTFKYNKELSGIIFTPTKLQARQIAENVGSDALCVTGIDKNHCFHFDYIMKRYANGDFRKKDVCIQCKKKDCDIRTQDLNFSKWRVLVACHAQYQRFTSKDELRKYNDAERDVFVIDEDVITEGTSNLYQLNDVTFSKVNVQYMGLKKLKLLDKQIKSFYQRCNKTIVETYYKPIDAAYQISDDARTAYRKNRLAVPSMYQGLDILDFIEGAIRNGFVVDAHKRIFSTLVKEIDLKELPAHVLLDGTPPKDEVYEAVFKCDDKEVLEIKIPTDENIEVFHVQNDDLPRKAMQHQFGRDRMQRYLESIIEKYPNEKFFIACTQEKSEFVMELFSEKGIPVLEQLDESTVQLDGDESKRFAVDEVRELTGPYVVVCYYGNVRGVRHAAGCTIAILLGSYFIPQAAGLLRALSFAKGIKSPRSMPLTKMKDAMKPSSFQAKYDFVNEFDTHYRMSEYHQAPPVSDFVTPKQECITLQGKGYAAGGGSPEGARSRWRIPANSPM